LRQTLSRQPLLANSSCKGYLDSNDYLCLLGAANRFS
jgi:hypothetical protein